MQNFFFTVHCTSNYLPTCKQIYPAFRPVYWQTSFLVTYFCRTRTRGQWHTPAQSQPRPGSSRSFYRYPPQCHCPFRCQFLSKLYQTFINVRVHRCIHFIKENRCIFSLWVLVKWQIIKLWFIINIFCLTLILLILLVIRYTKLITKQSKLLTSNDMIISPKIHVFFNWLMKFTRLQKSML